MCHSLSPQVNFTSSLDTGSGSNSASSSTSAAQSHLPLVALSPIIHPRIREVRTGLGSMRKGGCSISDVCSGPRLCVEV